MWQHEPQNKQKKKDSFFKYSSSLLSWLRPPFTACTFYATKLLGASYLERIILTSSGLSKFPFHFFLLFSLLYHLLYHHHHQQQQHHHHHLIYHHLIYHHLIYHHLIYH